MTSRNLVSREEFVNRLSTSFQDRRIVGVSGFIKYHKNVPIKIKLSETFDFDPVIWGVLASLLIGIAVTLLTPPPPRHLVRKFFYKG